MLGVCLGLLGVAGIRFGEAGPPAAPPILPTSLQGIGVAADTVWVALDRHTYVRPDHPAFGHHFPGVLMPEFAAVARGYVPDLVRPDRPWP